MRPVLPAVVLSGVALLAIAPLGGCHTVEPQPWSEALIGIDFGFDGGGGIGQDDAGVGELPDGGGGATDGGEDGGGGGDGGAAPKLTCPPHQLTQVELLMVALRFSQSFQCAFQGAIDGSGGTPPFPLSDLNAYGCYCGSGSTGLNTVPVDGFDSCCRQHDLDWTAICQNVKAPNGTDGCDCYVNLPAPTGCANNRLTFANNLNACQQACADELNGQFACYADAYNRTNYVGPNTTEYRNWCAWEYDPGVLGSGPSRPFDGGVLPMYCGTTNTPDYSSSFGPVEPETNVYRACTCFLDDRSCDGGNGTVRACVKGTAECQALGGSPGEDCYSGGSCVLDFDVTARPCGYRDPAKRCSR